MNKYRQNKIQCSFYNDLDIIMMSMVHSYTANQIDYIFKGVTVPLLAKYLYLNFLKYGTNRVIVLKLHYFFNLC